MPFFNGIIIQNSFENSGAAVASQMTEDFLLEKSDYTPWIDTVPLGEGKFGTVYKSEHRRSLRPVAVRVLRLDSNGEESGKYFFREVEVFRKIKPHPCFCLFRGIMLDPPALVSDYMPNGSLQRIVVNEGVSSIPPTVRAKTIFGFAVAMMQLHANGVMHRYLSPKNIFYDSEWNPKLSDFGFARIASKLEADVACTQVDAGEFWIYTAPESHTSNSYTPKVDVWSFGMIMYLLITCNPPLQTSKHTDKLKVIDGILRPEIPENVPEPLKQLLFGCWSSNPEQRPDFVEIVRDFLNYQEPFINDMDMDEYRAYQDRIMSATPVSHTDRVILNEPAITPENRDRFERVKAMAPRDAKKMVELGRMYKKGIGVQINLKAAFDCFHNAAKKGNIRAMFELAVILLKGPRDIRNAEQGFSWLTRAAETDKYPTVQFTLAMCLKNGIGTRKDPDRAKEIFRRLAFPPFERGDAMNYYAAMLENDEETAGEAREWYQKAWDQGIEAAACNLAVMLLKGKGGDQDLAGGLRIYERMAEQGFPEARYNLGKIYEVGLYGCDRDLEKAENLLRAAMEGGVVNAFCALAKMRLQEANACDEPERKFLLEKEAIEILDQVKDSENTTVLHILGVLMWEGRGVARTPDAQREAVRLLMRAAKREDGGRSALYLGDLLSVSDPGSVVATDIAKATRYYTMARERGVTEAADRLARLG